MARNIDFDEERAIWKAMAVFWKNGYSSTTIRDLTDAMGINSSSLYNTIGDKRQLFVKCVSNYTRNVTEAAKVYMKNDSPLEGIISYINDAVTSILGGTSCLAIQTTFELASNDAEIQSLIKATNAFVHDMLLGMIKRAEELKEIGTEIDAETKRILSSIPLPGGSNLISLIKTPYGSRKWRDT